jgi:outer membrane protein assembly factor BamB
MTDRRFSFSIPTLIAAVCAAVAGIGLIVQFPAIRHALIYGERFVWDAYPAPRAALATDAAQADVALSTVTLSGSEDTRINRVSYISNGALRWESAALEDKDSKPILALDTQLVFVGFTDGLQALERADGKPRWAVKLDGKLGFCYGCVHRYEASVLALTDSSLSSYDAASGALQWRQPVKTREQNIMRAGRRLLVLTATSANLYDPAAQGAVTVLPLACSKPGRRTSFNPIAIASPEPDNNTVYVRGDGCVKRWDARSGALLWETLFQAEGLGQLSTYQGLSWRNTGQLLRSDAHVFASVGEGVRDTMVRSIVLLDPETGRARTVISSTTDYLVPLLAPDPQHLLIRVKDLNGLVLDRAWLIDVDSGARIWEYKPEMFDWQLLRAPGGELTVVQYGERETRNQVKPMFNRAVRADVVVVALDPALGTPLGEPFRQPMAESKWFNIGLRSPEALYQPMDSVVLNFGSLYVYDLQKRAFTYHWP